MTEEDWGSDFDQPVKRKSRVRPLVWVAGSGCLLVLVLVIVAVVWGARLYGKASDPDIQWPRVAEVLPFGERPTDVEVVGFPGQTWLFRLPGDEYHILLTQTSAAGEEHRELFFGQAERFKLEVQGRELTAVRPESQGEDGAPSGGSFLSRFKPGPSIVVELSPPGAPDLLMLQFTSVGSKEPVPEDLVVDFLDRFELGQIR